MVKGLIHLLDENKNVELILDTLEKSVWGLTIEELSKQTGLHRNTISKYMQKLEDAGLVVKKQVGKYTFWQLRSVYVYFESDMVKRFIESIVITIEELGRDCGLNAEKFGIKIGEKLTKLAIEKRSKKIKGIDIKYNDTLKDFADIYMPTLVPKMKVKVVRPNFTDKMAFLNFQGCPNKIDNFELMCNFLKGYIKGVLNILGVDYKSVEIIDSSKDDGLCKYGIIFNKPVKEIVETLREKFGKNDPKKIA